MAVQRLHDEPWDESQLWCDPTMHEWESLQAGLMSQYHRLQLKQYTQLLDRETDESRFWKRFRAPVVHKFDSSVTSMAFCPTEPHDLAATYLMSVAMVNGQSGEVIREIGGFRQRARGVHFRPDGQLICVGGDDPTVKVFRVGSRGVLRALKGHKAPVHCTRFSSTGNRVLSCSDDRTCRLWDLASQQPVALMAGHTDYVRSASQSPASPHVWATGSYDGTVRLWDVRAPSLARQAQNSRQSVGFNPAAAAAAGHIGALPTAAAGEGCTAVLDHGAAVTDTLLLRSGTVLVTSGSNKVKVWDLLSGGKLLHTLEAHQKTVMSLAVDGTGARLLAGGLDGHVKVFDLSTFELVHGFKHDGAILSLAVSPDNTRLAIGGADGRLSLRRRTVRAEQGVSEAHERAIVRAGTERFLLRGKAGAGGGSKGLVVQHARKPKLTGYDRLLKKFRYGEALDRSLETHDPVVVVSMLEELTRRSGLRIALTGRDEASLEPLVLFLGRHISHPHYSDALIDVMNILLDLYAPVLGRSAVIDGLFLRVQRKVDEEAAVQQQLLALQGQVDLLITAASGAAAAAASGGPQTGDLPSLPARRQAGREGGAAAAGGAAGAPAAAAPAPASSASATPAKPPKRSAGSKRRTSPRDNEQEEAAGQVEAGQQAPSDQSNGVVAATPAAAPKSSKKQRRQSSAKKGKKRGGKRTPSK